MKAVRITFIIYWLMLVTAFLLPGSLKSLKSEFIFSLISFAICIINFLLASLKLKTVKGIEIIIYFIVDILWISFCIILFNELDKCC